MTNFLRILHISDLHFTSSKTKTDKVWGNHNIVSGDFLSDDLVTTFLKNLKNFLNQKYPHEDKWPKIVIVSGDLVEKGGCDTGEFEKASKFLSDLAGILKLGDKKRIFVVPGNHDVNWNTGKDLEERFKNYFKAVEEFSSPELTRKELTVFHEDLSNLVEDVSLEVTLFISPTYSGVRDPENRKICKRVEKLQEKASELQEQSDENTTSQENFRLLDIAAIGADQRSQIEPSKNANKEPIRIAVLHHHLLPDDRIEISQFESVVDAGKMLDSLIDKKYDLVLTGHKHNRRLVNLSNTDRTGALDVYTSPSLFKGEGRGFTIIDIYSPKNSYYATLHYYDLSCNEIKSPQKLLREGRLLPQVSEVCASITPPDQAKILLPVLKSVEKITKLAKEPLSEDFFEEVWQQISEEIEDISNGRLLFRPPRIWEQWTNIINLAGTKQEIIQLVSNDDLDYWLTANEDFSEAGKYSKPLREFQGEKVRILVLSKYNFIHKSEIQKCIETVENMTEQGFKIAIVPRNMITTDVMKDFGIIGNFAVSKFEGQERYTRYLTESFNIDDLKEAKRHWSILWDSRVWDSDGTEEIRTFMNRYSY